MVAITARIIFKAVQKENVYCSRMYYMQKTRDKHATNKPISYANGRCA